ncbi:MAG TPA: bifunctional phosphoribosylaminoimidazolecarboxamide formyltransferase/IMP cyclohydrolase [Polyangiales bacterium]|nr:bifunctional phosphoribosylaminoimidazolecarboxamide formyltransferase/IMP cyclohydrolase [Polyangiales bacterium]
MGAIRRALVSVSDKTGIVDLGKALHAKGVTILSTGGTAKSLRDAGVPVTDVSEYTKSPEIMDGRVKTLHPRVHGGILMRDSAGDRKQLEEIGGMPIDLVVVNLYPFTATVERGAPHEEVIENIDIGGPSMLRSAAKNHARVTVVVDPSDYAAVIAAIDSGTDQAFRSKLAAKAFTHTARYDSAIAGYLTSVEEDGSRNPFPGTFGVVYERAYGLRYGENPHQKGAFYRDPAAPAGSLARAEVVSHGSKELSFNNLVDLEAALDAVREFERPAAVVVKHTNPCGVSVAEKLVDAYRVARDADALSAFGGIVALNREVDDETAAVLAETFIECIVAPSYAANALARLQQKKNLRLLATGAWLGADHRAYHLKQVGGGMLVEDRDNTAGAEVRDAKVVTKRAPTAEEKAALEFAWRVCKHVKSNAIVLAKLNEAASGSSRGERTVGVGAGQMSRVVSVEIAVKKAGPEAKGSVLASDAFFPFPDGVEAAAAAGVTAVVQPGGSVKDPDVIAACDKAGVAMIVTGFRHFRH